jgi:hypothetical protein
VRRETLAQPLESGFLRGDARIAGLADHIVKLAFVYRHQWRVGDLSMWDNCMVQHRAIQDYHLSQRPANAPYDYGRYSSTLGDE